MSRSGVSILRILLACCLLSCSSHFTVKNFEHQQYRLSTAENVVIDSSVYVLLKPFRDTLQKVMNRPLAVSSEALAKIELSNFAADACLSTIEKHSLGSQQPKIDFMLMNRGGLRTALPKGAITLGNIYELMPFENSIVILKLDGATVLRLCDVLAKHVNESVAGITITTNDQGEAQDILIQGQPFEKSKSYYVATSDYLANGGGGFDLNSSLERHACGVKVRDAIITYLTDLTSAGDTLKPNYEQRIKK